MDLTSTPSTLTESNLQDLLVLAEQARANTKRPLRVRARTRDPNHIPRPVNCFLAYRLEKHKEISARCPGVNHREISKLVAKWWREASEEEKEKYRDIARKEQQKHAAMYPGYKYAPKQSRRSIKKQKAKLKGKMTVDGLESPHNDGNTTTSANSCQSIMELLPGQLLATDSTLVSDQDRYQTKLTTQPISQDQLQMLPSWDPVLTLGYPPYINLCTSPSGPKALSIHSETPPCLGHSYSPVSPLLTTPLTTIEQPLYMLTDTQVAAGSAIFPPTTWTEREWCDPYSHLLIPPLQNLLFYNEY